MSGPPTITVHYLENSRATQFVAFLEELSIPYDLKLYRRPAADALRTVHPLGKSPVMEIHIANQPPLVLAEQAVMIEYICDYFSYRHHLIPERFAEGQKKQIGKETEEWKKWKYFMSYIEGSFSQYLLLDRVACCTYISTSSRST